MFTSQVMLRRLHLQVRAPVEAFVAYRRESDVSARTTRRLHHLSSAQHLVCKSPMMIILTSRAHSTLSQDIIDRGFKLPIPSRNLQFTFMNSSGAGGQSVQKNLTKVRLRFHVNSAGWITDRTKIRLLLMKNNMSNDGYFSIESEKERSQYQNKRDCEEKLTKILVECSVGEYVMTAEDLSIQKAKQKRIDDKHKKANQRRKRNAKQWKNDS